MIPFFQQPSISFGPITIHAFGVVTALAVVVGLWLAGRRALGAGLDPEVNEGLTWYALVFGFVGAHVYSVLLYFPGGSSPVGTRSLPMGGGGCPTIPMLSGER